MSNVVIALLASAGLSAWIYSKVMKTTGNNTQNALIVAGISGFIGFLLLLAIFNMVIPD